MTRKDFKLIAATLKDCRADVALASDPTREMAVTDLVIARFARALKSTNPRFNADRFIEACKD